MNDGSVERKGIRLGAVDLYLFKIQWNFEQTVRLRLMIHFLQAETGHRPCELDGD